MCGWVGVGGVEIRAGDEWFMLVGCLCGWCGGAGVWVVCGGGGKKWGANAMSNYVLCAWFCQA